MQLSRFRPDIGTSTKIALMAAVLIAVLGTWQIGHSHETRLAAAGNDAPGIANDAYAGLLDATLVDWTVPVTAIVSLLVFAIGLEQHRRRTRRIERAAAEINHRYRLLAENSSDLVTVKPISAASLSYVSPSSKAVLGWEPAEFAALPDAQSIHPDDYTNVMAEHASLGPDNPRVVSRHRLCHKAGHFVWVEAVFLLTGIGSPDESVIVSARDVTTRIQAEDARIASEDLYRLLAENSGDLIALKSTFEGALAYVSPSSRSTVGWEPAELAELPQADYLHPDDFDRVRAEFTSLSADNPRMTSVHRVRHKAGHYLWVECVFQLTAIGTIQESVVVAGRDITVRYRAEENLRESEARYRLLAHASSDMVSRISLDGHWTYVSPAATEILGYAPSQLMGQNPLAFMHPEDVEHLSLLMEGLVQGLCDQARSVHRAKHKLGRDVWVDVQFRLVRNETSNEPLEIVSSLRDVTDRELLRQRAEEVNRQLIEAEEIAHVGHWRLDLGSGLLEWSNEVYRIHGLDPTDSVVTLERAVACYHPDDRAEFKRLTTVAVATRKSFQSKLRVACPDGKLRTVLYRGFVEMGGPDEEVQALYGAILDVTEATEAEQRLRRESALLETTLDNMEQGLVEVAPDGTIMVANTRFIELLDLPGELFDQQKPNFADVLAHLDQVERSRAAAGNAHLGSNANDLLQLGTHEYHRPNGVVLEVRTVQLRRGGSISTFADITARRQAEAAMRESEARYRILAETTSDVVTQLGIDLDLQFVSPACRTVLGYRPAEMRGRPSLDLIHPDDVGQVRKLMSGLLAGDVDGDRATLTFRSQHKNGHWIWLEAGVNLVRNGETKAPVSIICSLRDVTERQWAARHLERARAAAEQAMMAKAEFVANMSHELRTPLTGMLGVHDLLQRDTQLGVAQRRLVSLASDSGRSLLRIVNDILDFSKIEAGQLAIDNVPFDLRALVETCQALGGEGLKGKSIALTANFDPPAPGWFVGDPSRLQQVILNLLTNAVKFTEHGAVTINVQSDVVGGLARVSVTDTGIGIPAEKVPLLFERFSQADASTARRYGGTGLGLAISKQLIELMGGRIGVTTKDAEGSCFWFELPLRPHAAGAESTALPASMHIEQRGCRTLLAEDNPINQEIISAMLTHCGHVVTAVGDGAAAVAALAEGDRFDVVLMDLQMPDVDGLQATEIIRRAERADGRRRLPIIGLTANAMAEDVARCLEAGMDGHVAKPIDWPELFAAINRTRSVSMSDDPATTPTAVGDEVLDQSTLEGLARIIGPARLGKLLQSFTTDLQRRVEGLNGESPAVLSAQAHSLVSMAGQFGFRELSKLCADVEAEAREGGGLRRLGEIDAAAQRALAVAKTHPLVQAA